MVFYKIILYTIMHIYFLRNILYASVQTLIIALYKAFRNA